MPIDPTPVGSVHAAMEANWRFLAAEDNRILAWLGVGALAAVTALVASWKPAPPAVLAAGQRTSQGAPRDALAIRERLAAADPGNAGWQRDLSVSHNKLGDVLRDQGDGAAALRSYRDALAIAERLAAADPGNAEWQRDLIVSCWRLAEAAPAEARAWLARALGIARDLAASGRLAPVDAWMPGELERRLAALGP